MTATAHMQFNVRRGGGRVADDGSVAELTSAIDEADVALALIDLADFTFLSVSDRALEFYGLPATAVVGRPATDFVKLGDRDAATAALTALRDRVISVYVAHRELRAAPDASPMTTQWLRAFDVGDRRLALAQASPASDDDMSPIALHFGHEPTRVAIGTVDRSGVVTAMSTDITQMLGVPPQKLIGTSLLDTVARRDVAALLDATHRRPNMTVGVTVHLRDRDEQWVDLCCLLTPLEGNPDRCFILARSPIDGAEHARVSALERHLVQIAGIVEASGVLQQFGPMRDMRTVPEINNLTARQWEILARIVRGQRVPTIAAELHVSQSTVRSHLSVIFKRFGVRSQPELLRALEAPAAIA